jgi:hypothetical protein
LDVIQTTVSAVENFKLAGIRYKESYKRVAQAELELETEENSANEPGLMGLVESNLLLVEFLCKHTLELRDDLLKDAFLQLLRREQSRMNDLSLLFIDCEIHPVGRSLLHSSWTSSTRPRGAFRRPRGS